MYKETDMENYKEKESLRDRLIIAGIDEIAERGVSDFSLRRVAAACNTSCAAPYKHFKNKDELILAIIDYINSQWLLLKNQILEVFSSDLQKALTEVCIAYIRFWMTNPNYRTVLSRETHNFLSDRSQIGELVGAYCDKANIVQNEKSQRIYAVTALIYGTTSMLENGELPNDESTFSMIRASIAKIL